MVSRPIRTISIVRSCWSRKWSRVELINAASVNYIFLRETHLVIIVVLRLLVSSSASLTNIDTLSTESRPRKIQYTCKQTNRQVRQPDRPLIPYSFPNSRGTEHSGFDSIVAVVRRRNLKLPQIFSKNIGPSRCLKCCYCTAG